jgi:hypothetical protein
MQARLRAFVERFLSVERYGGRCVVRDERTLLVYDVGRWGPEHTRAVQAAFPECEVGLEACSASLSGFVVVLRADPQPYATVGASLFALLLVGAAWTAHSLLAGHARI